MTDPTVAVAAYSYQGLRWLADRMAVRMSGPPKVGMGELSRMARKKSPRAPRWRRVAAKVRDEGRLWTERTGAACWLIDQGGPVD